MKAMASSVPGMRQPEERGLGTHLTLARLCDLGK